MAAPRLRADRIPASWVPNLEELVTIEEGKRRRSKYGAIKTTHNGRVFDSKLEAEVAKMIDLLRLSTNPAERVIDVQYQVPFILDPKRGKERAVKYMADFVVTFQNPRRVVVIEAKGKETAVWRLKYRLFRTSHPDSTIRVVRKPNEVVAISQEKA